MIREYSLQVFIYLRHLKKKRSKGKKLSFLGDCDRVSLSLDEGKLTALLFCRAETERTISLQQLPVVLS